MKFSRHKEYQEIPGPYEYTHEETTQQKLLRWLKLAWLPIIIVLGIFAMGFLLIGIDQGQQQCSPDNLIGGVFCLHYRSVIIGAVPSLSSFYGGMTFKPGDPNTLLVAGHADTPQGAIYSVKVIRDAKGKISGFKPAVFFASAPGIDSSVIFDPAGRGILLASVYPTNQIYQYQPGSTTPDFALNLTLEASIIEPKIGAITIVPSGYQGTGKVWIASYDANTLSTADMLWDDTQQRYRLVYIENHGAILPTGVEGFFFPPLGSVHLLNRILVTSYDDGALYAMELDHNGIPRPNSWGQTLDFLTGLYGIEGAAMDPITGDMLFSHSNGSTIVRVEGFASPRGTSSPASSLRSAYAVYYLWIIKAVLDLFFF